MAETATPSGGHLERPPGRPVPADVEACGGRAVDIAAALRRARAQSRRLTRHVRLPAIAIGALLCAPSVTQVPRRWEQAYQPDACLPLVFAIWFMRSLGAIALLLAILPSDRVAPRVGSLVMISLKVATDASTVLLLLETLRTVAKHGLTPDCRRDLWLVGPELSSVLVSVWECATAIQGLRRPPRQNLYILWWIVGLNHFAAGCSFLLLLPRVVIDIRPDGSWAVQLTNICLNSAYGVGVGLLLWWPAFRRRIHYWLYIWEGTVTAAATVAAFIGGRDPEYIFQKACTSSRCVTLDKVTEEDLLACTPDPSLRAHSTPCRLEEVDAFLSHSWHDPPKAKWAALQAWRAKFKAQHTREPRMWIDKYCIDQTNIEDSLMCLPVFLAACQSLLVLAGPTYLSRLWCVEEVFIHLQMGRGVCCLTLIPLSDEVDEQVDKFDVRAARCHLQRDQATLLATIEAGCSDFDSFNEEVRWAMRQASRWKG